MKKICIFIIFILLSTILYLVCTRGFSMGAIRINNLKSIQSMAENLDNKRIEANEKNVKDYPNSLSKLKEAINSLNIVKNKYTEKVRYMGEDVNINALQIEKYKIEFLWTKLGKYADENQVKMQMDVIESKENVYDLSFNIIGSYINVTDFIYDIEKDAELNFRISDLKLIPDSTTATTTITTEEGSQTEKETPYSASVSITKTKNNENTNTSVDSENEIDESEQNKNQTTTSTKKLYSPKHLEASFKVYGLEINFD